MPPGPPPRAGSEPGEKIVSGPSIRADRLKIHTLNRKCIVIPVWFESVKFTIDRQWYYWVRQNHEQHSRVPGPLPGGQVPVIFTGFPPSRRHGLLHSHETTNSYQSELVLIHKHLPRNSLSIRYGRIMNTQLSLYSLPPDLPTMTTIWAQL